MAGAGNGTADAAFAGGAGGIGSDLDVLGPWANSSVHSCLFPTSNFLCSEGSPGLPGITFPRSEKIKSRLSWPLTNCTLEAVPSAAALQWASHTIPLCCSSVVWWASPAQPSAASLEQHREQRCAPSGPTGPRSGPLRCPSPPKSHAVVRVLARAVPVLALFPHLPRSLEEALSQALMSPAACPAAPEGVPPVTHVPVESDTTRSVKQPPWRP